LTVHGPAPRTHRGFFGPHAKRLVPFLLQCELTVTGRRLAVAASCRPSGWAAQFGWWDGEDGDKDTARGGRFGRAGRRRERGQGDADHQLQELFLLVAPGLAALQDGRPRLRGADHALRRSLH